MSKNRHDADPKRPGLEPIWTQYRNLGGMPKTAFKPKTSQEDWTPSSTISPNSLPSPMYPAASYSDYFSNSHHERSVSLASLEGRPRPRSPARDLRSIDEEDVPLVSQLERITIFSPLTMPHGLPSPPESTHLFSPQPQRDHLNRARTVLESKTTTPRHHGRTEPFHSPNLGRSNSTVTENTRPLPPPPPPPRRQSVLEIREQLGNWGHVYYGNAKTADAFVIARSLRRYSTSASTLVKPHEDVGSPKFRLLNRLTVRAIIRPKAVDRQSFLIQRTFDVDELRSTIPDPPPSSRFVPLSPISERQISGWGSDGDQTLNYQAQHFAERRRRSSVKSGELLSGRGRSSVGVDHESLIRDARAVPIHLKYASAYLPVLAALLVSGHVREGDVIYLPLPHAEAWPQTVKYIYTGQCELTGAMRDNILCLAGKV